MMPGLRVFFSCMSHCSYKFQSSYVLQIGPKELRNGEVGGGLGYRLRAGGVNLILGLKI